MLKKSISFVPIFPLLECLGKRKGSDQNHIYEAHMMLGSDSGIGISRVEFNASRTQTLLCYFNFWLQVLLEETFYL